MNSQSSVENLGSLVHLEKINPVIIPISIIRDTFLLGSVKNQKIRESWWSCRKEVNEELRIPN